MAKRGKNDLGSQWEDLHERAVDLYEAGDLAGAEKALARARSVAERLRDNGDPGFLGMTLNTLAGVLRDQDRLDEAAAANLEAFAILEKTLPRTDYDLAGTARNAARILAGAGRHEEAIRYYETALGLMAESLPPEHAQIGLTLAWMAESMTQVPARGGEAAASRERAWKIALADEIGEDLFEIGRTLARGLSEAGDPAGARATLQRLLEAQRRAYSLPTGPLKRKNPYWVLNFHLARAIVLREEYRKKKEEPDRMLQVRFLLGNELVALQDGAAALEQFEILERAIEAMRSGPETDEIEGERDEVEEAADEQELADGEDEAEEDPDEEEDEDSDDEGADGDGEDFDEDDDDESSGAPRANQPGWKGLDPAAVALGRAMSLHLVGQKEKSREKLGLARASYQAALGLASESPNREWVEENVEGNLAELESDLAGL